jgi:capsular polysaccharide biosynthesis protein
MIKEENNCVKYDFIENAKVDDVGRVCTSTKCIETNACMGGIGNYGPGIWYNKVIVISQYWGEGYFHFLLEVLPRLSFVIDLIDPETKIHVPSAPFIPFILESLGVDRHRLVSGNVRGNIIYPETTQCGYPKLNRLVALRDLLSKQDCPVRVFNKRFITIISRKGTRRMINEDQLVNRIKNYFSGLFEVVVFQPSPLKRCSNFQDMEVFKNSVMIIGAHGAGLSNMVVSNPGTIIIEIQTIDFNMCYIDVSFRLGFKHFVLFDEKANQNSNIEVNINEVIQAIEQTNLKK